MTILESVILGLVEGLTEFLPISSTGHMMIASHLMGLEPTPFLKTFEIAIQLGAISAVAGEYAGRVLKNGKLMKNILIILYEW